MDWGGSYGQKVRKLPGPVVFPLLLPSSWEKYVETPQNLCACTATALDQNVDDTRFCLNQRFFTKTSGWNLRPTRKSKNLPFCIVGANVVFRKSYFAFQLAAAHKCDILVIVYLPEIRPKGKHTGFRIALLVAAPKLNKDHTET